MPDKEQDEFKVNDRRRFKADGTVREEALEERKEADERRAAERLAGEEAARKEPEASDVDISSFVVGLATQVLVLLGEIPHPETGQKLEQKELAAAKQTIDILGLIEQKTAGNLNQHEEKLLEEVLRSVRTAGTESGADEVASQQEVNFSSFVIGLATQVMMMLGEIPHPETGQLMKQTDAAKQTIDVLAVLEAKTKGNLSKDEQNLLAEVLASVRIAFVQVVKQNQ